MVHPCATIVIMVNILIRLASAAVAVWFSTFLIPGIHVTATTTGGTVITVILVALIFGVVNTVIKPIVKMVGCGLYVMTLGLIALVVNGLLFWLVGWLAGEAGLPFTVDDFWPSAVLGALLVSIVTWAAGLVFKDQGED